MKLTKLTILATAATLALGVYSAKAAPGTVTNYSKLNVSLTITTNLPSTYDTSTSKYTYTTKKIKGRQQTVAGFVRKLGWR